MGTIFEVFIELVTILFLFLRFFFWGGCHKARGTLPPRPGMEFTPLALEGKALTISPAGKSCFVRTLWNPDCLLLSIVTFKTICRKQVWQLRKMKAHNGKLEKGRDPWCWERPKAGGEGGDRGWDGWMASATRWTWVWASSGSWWWTGRPGVLQSMGSQSCTRVSNLTTKRDDMKICSEKKKKH